MARARRSHALAVIAALAAPWACRDRTIHDYDPVAPSSSTAASSSAPVAAAAPPACEIRPGPAPATAPVVTRRPWRNAHSKVTALAAPRHRGRDQILSPGEPQWIVAKLAYGKVDKDLEDEDVEIHLLRAGATAWELVATARTLEEDAKPPIAGFDEAGGRVFFRIPDDKALGLGFHRVRVVVPADGTHAELAIAVAPRATKLVVSDVDGTLTGSEVEEFTAMAEGELPSARTDAARALGLLAARGHLPVYLTARPDWLVPRTRAFLRGAGFPEGVVRTMTNAKGSFGDGAAAFKLGELDAIAGRGLAIAWGFGNMPSDIDAYAPRVERAGQRVFYQLDVPAGRGRRIESYGELLAELEASSPVCR